MSKWGASELRAYQVRFDGTEPAGHTRFGQPAPPPDLYFAAADGDCDSPGLERGEKGEREGGGDMPHG